MSKSRQWRISMIDTAAFGNKIRTLRMEHGLSQQQLADKMYVTIL